MTKRDFIEKQLSKIQSDEIIFNKEIPKFVKDHLKISEIIKGVPIDFYDDNSFALFVDLIGGKGIAILFAVTMYNELFCKLCYTPCPHETREKISENIKELIKYYE
jgi:hypothetical protein